MKERFADVPGWTFDIEEVSANVYEVIGVDTAGHRVEAKGTDPEQLLADARTNAKRILEASRR